LWEAIASAFACYDGALIVPVTPLTVAIADVNRTVPKLANVESLRPIPGASTIHSAVVRSARGFCVAAAVWYVWKESFGRLVSTIDNYS
jgi:hypothetical protein